LLCSYTQIAGLGVAGREKELLERSCMNHASCAILYCFIYLSN